MSADSAGNLYALTGNGSFNGDVGGRNFGNSFIKVSPTGALLDWFTPFNWSFLNATDEDLGIQNALLIPNTNLVVGGGKEGVMYVARPQQHGAFPLRQQRADPPELSGVVGRADERLARCIGTARPTVPRSMSGRRAIRSKCSALSVGCFRRRPALREPRSLRAACPEGCCRCRRTAARRAQGILWAALSRGGDANHAPQPGILRAYDASNVTRELWNSQQNATRDALGNFSKFSPPTVANGKVFVPSLSNKLVVYGLIGPSASNAAPVVNAGADQNLTGPGTATLTGTATDDGNPIPPGQLTTTWSLASGPASVTIGAPNALSTTASFTVAGVYTIRLTAFDGEATTSDDVIVTVDPPAGSGTGLLAQYFNDAGSGIYFTALVLTRTDPTVDFDWASAAPDPRCKPTTSRFDGADR